LSNLEANLIKFDNINYENSPYAKIGYLEGKLEIAIEALETIAKQDISSNPDKIWLVNWRNNTKELAQLTLDKLTSERKHDDTK
jgi:hypothetical protein